jgi:DNA-binding beta-propeller fold protein YncE
MGAAAMLAALGDSFAAGYVLVEQSSFGGPGHAELYPSGVGIAPDGSVVVADTGNDRVRAYRADGAVRWTVGATGNGINRFAEPRHLDFDAAGNVYVTDASNGRVVKLSPSGGWIKSWRGPAGNLQYPMGISVKHDKIYLTEPPRAQVRVWNLAMDRELARIGASPNCPLTKVRDVDADSAGLIYVADHAANTVSVFREDGTCLRQVSVPTYGLRIEYDPVLGQELMYSGTGQLIRVYDREWRYLATIGGVGQYVADWNDPAASIHQGTFSGLRFFDVGLDGHVWAGDFHGYQVEHFARTSSGWRSAGVLPDPLVAPPLEDDRVFNQVRGIDVNDAGVIHAVDHYNNRLVRIAEDGSILNACGNRADMAWAGAVAVDDRRGEIWHSRGILRGLRVIRANCTELAKVSGSDNGVTALGEVRGLAIDVDAGLVYVADTFAHRIVVIDAATRRATGTFGSKGSGSGFFNQPHGLAFDRGSGRLFVADTGNHRIVALRTDGRDLHWERAMWPGLNRPEDVAVDPGGTLLIADTLNNRVVVVSAEGTILASAGGLSSPVGVATDSGGTFYASDQWNDVIRKYRLVDLDQSPIDVCGPPDLRSGEQALLLIWRECDFAGPGVRWSVRVTGGGSATALRYAGKVSSAGALSAVGVKLEPNDVVDDSRFGLVDFDLHAQGLAQDGFVLDMPAAQSACFDASILPAGAAVVIGGAAVDAPAMPFRLPDLAPCSIADDGPNNAAACGMPSFDKSTEMGLFAWRDCEDTNATEEVWHFRAAGGGSPGLVEFSGHIKSEDVSSATGFLLERNDVLAFRADSTLDFILKVVGAGQDGIELRRATGSPACVTITGLPAGAAFELGAIRAPVSGQTLDLATLMSCR